MWLSLLRWKNPVVTSPESDCIFGSRPLMSRQQSQAPGCRPAAASQMIGRSFFRNSSIRRWLLGTTLASTLSK